MISSVVNFNSMNNNYFSIYALLQKQPPRLFSKISVLFFQEHLFLEFPRRLNVFTEHISIFQEGMSVHRTDTDFPEAVFFGYRTDTDFPEATFCYRTDNDFPGSLFRISTNRQAISRKVTPSEQIFQLQQQVSVAAFVQPQTDFYSSNFFFEQCE